MIVDPTAPTPEHDCGHVCCDERQDPLHDHFLAASSCPRCTAPTPEREVLAVIAANDDRWAHLGMDKPTHGLPFFEHVSDLTDEQADWDSDE